MNGLSLFENPKFGKVRTITEDGKVLFCGSDVAKALGYAKPQNAIERHCRCALKRGIPHPQSPDKTIEMLFITEGDVIRLTARSPLPEAAKVESWIFDEVVPSVLHHGAYMTPATIKKIFTNPDSIIQLGIILKEEQQRREKAEAQRDALEEQAKINRPKVAFADAVSGAQNTIIIRELAKVLRQNGIEIGEKRLFAWMREEGYLIKARGRDYNAPTQRSIEAGWMEQKETAIAHTSGTRTHFTPLVTGKGQQYFVRLFLDKKGQEA